MTQHRILIITYALSEELNASEVKNSIDIQAADCENRQSTLKAFWNKLIGRDIHREVVILKTGIGKMNSAVRLSRYIDIANEVYDHPEITVLNLGTAASVDTPIGSIVECTCYNDRDMLRLNYGDISEWIVDPADEFVPDYEKVLCSSGDSFVTSLNEVELREGLTTVFDMEAFAQARVCWDSNVDFMSYKYITDYIGENSLGAWESQLPEACLSLTEKAISEVKRFFVE